mmetsp:Transcript_105636/g.340681  ORF Transcript_105636/g.340681 Transcript_105636/m.340681 type:complete len:224 (-) Transcript_105636:94-765(-)
MVARRKAVQTRPKLGQAKAAKAAKAVKLTGSGQPFVSSGLCIATGRKDGKPCCRKTGAAGVPYCKEHMRSGDPSLCVVEHHLAGKILVAARDLPKGYRAALWGRLKRKKEMRSAGMEWAFDFQNGWMLDPTGCKGSLVQFCACPGPNEAAAVLATSTSWTDAGDYGSWVFVTKEALPRHWQLTMQYGNNSKGSEAFFTERGLTRVDVGTELYPALRRKDAQPQ